MSTVLINFLLINSNWFYFAVSLFSVKLDGRPPISSDVLVGDVVLKTIITIKLFILTSLKVRCVILAKDG